jgi:hypothetical protein
MLRLPPTRSNPFWGLNHYAPLNPVERFCFQRDGLSITSAGGAGLYSRKLSELNTNKRIKRKDAKAQRSKETAEISRRDYVIQPSVGR